MSTTVLLVSIASLALIALICAVISHKLIQSYWRANVYTVFYTLVIFHGFSDLEAGSIDPNWPISSAIVSAVAIAVAIVAGKYFQVKRGF